MTVAENTEMSFYENFLILPFVLIVQMSKLSIINMKN